MSFSDISIVIPAYNASATITRAIHSALIQPEVSQVIVVDDASTDNTVNTARLADDNSGRLKILVQTENKGPSAARNRAISESNAGWIGILDADDFFLPGRLERLMELADRADFIADDMVQVPEDNIHGQQKKLLGDALIEVELVGFEEFVLSNITRTGRSRKELGFLKPLMRREFLVQNSLHYQEDMRLGEDYELYARALALRGRFYLVPGQGYVSVVRPASLSGKHSIADLQRLRDCNTAIEQQFTLSPAEKHALRQHYLSMDCRLQWRLLIEAVKEKNPVAAAKTFLKPLPVPFYLAARLAEQCLLRLKRLGPSRAL